MSWLFRPIPIASLVLFRLVFGILGFADVLGIWLYYHFVTDAFNPDRVQFKFIGFEWLPVFHDPWMSIFFILTLISALLIFLGKWYRPATTFFAFAFTYLFLLEKAHYLNHGYLFCWISFIMIFLPADRALSLDILSKPWYKRSQVPFWSMAILPYMMGMVYFFGGIAKINPDWLNGIPLIYWLENKKDLFLIGPLVAQDWVAYFMSYGGLLLDLFVVFFLLNKRTRIWAFCFVLFFHFTNLLIFNIGIFPVLSITLTSLYFAPDYPVKIWNWLAKRIPILNRVTTWWKRREQKAGFQELSNEPIWQEQALYRPAIIIGIIALTAIHVFLPLRHHLYSGDVAWTEEGHRFSWRMMLRSKQAYGHFRVVDLDSGQEEKQFLKGELTKKQSRKLYTHPDMIWQMAQHLKKRYEAEGRRVAIYAVAKARLNGGKYCTYIDPEVDLCQVEWEPFNSAEWILTEEVQEQD